MNLPVMALLSRAIQMENRRWTAYGARMFMAGVLFLVIVAGREPLTRLGAPGLTLFRALLFVNLFFISVAALKQFTSAITEEKEEGMLGLLKMTGLDPISILLGKCGGRVASLILLLLVQLPFTLLAVTLGGVTLRQILAGYAMLVCYTFFLCGLGAFCSVVSKKSAGASALCTFILLGFFAVPFAGLQIIRARVADGTVTGWEIGLEPVLNWFRDASPVNRIATITQTGFAGWLMGSQGLNNLALGTLFFGLAWLGFERWTREEREHRSERHWVARRSSRFRFFRPSPVWKRPITWKDFYFTMGGKAALLAKGVLLAMLFGGVAGVGYWSDRRDDLRELGQMMMGLSLFFIGLDLLISLGHTFGAEVKGRTFPAIFVLPYTHWELVRQKVAGCLPGLAPYVVVFLIGAVFAPMDFLRALATAVSESFCYPLFAFVACAGYAAIYGGLNPKRKVTVNQVVFVIIFVVAAFVIGVIGAASESAPLTSLLLLGLMIVTAARIHRAIDVCLLRVAAEES